ncbi:MAG TPA: hypothetical protein VGF46_13370 [Gaiellales bacterium]|jgi:hypothetical protein
MLRWLTPALALLVVLVAASAPADAAPAHAASARATLIPRATFARKADAICTTENARRAKGPQLTSFTPATATRTQVMKAGKVLAYEYPIGVDEIARISALGQPRELPARAAWTRLHTLLLHTVFPAIRQIAASGTRGDVATFRTQFAALSSHGTEESTYGKAIGFTVCGQ